MTSLVVTLVRFLCGLRSFQVYWTLPNLVVLPAFLVLAALHTRIVAW